MKHRRNWNIYRKARIAGWPKGQATKYSQYKIYEGHREKPMDLWRDIHPRKKK